VRKASLDLAHLLSKPLYQQRNSFSTDIAAFALSPNPIGAAMTPAPPDWDSVLTIVRDVYEHLPFNELLGLQVDHLEPERAGLRFKRRDELVGNVVQGILHGGVISAVLDTTGGVMATISALGRMLENGSSQAEMAASFARIGTIDMRVDYLRPGRGEHFVSTATIMRTGKTVAVTRMELTNDDGFLIAVGTGAYKIG
jgi:uncharacterized protein (TIGR00369 family)